MGCDIHIHTEIKINGKWEHMANGSYVRDYQMFGFVAGVRDDSMDLLVEPKGLPNDASAVTQFCADYEGIDAHTRTWLDASEIVKLEEWLSEYRDDNCPEIHWGYLLGNSWGGFTKYPENRPKGIEDVRFVIWFDS